MNASIKLCINRIRASCGPRGWRRTAAHRCAPVVITAVPISAGSAGVAVAIWLLGIIVNLLTYSEFFDVALRDFGLLLGAPTLDRLASLYDPAWGHAGQPSA
jgi:hypothetical protein